MPACAGFIVQGRNEANSANSKTNGTSFEGMQVNVFPNPSQADFSIQVFTAGKEQVRVSVMDIAGRKISTCQLAPYQTMSIGSGLKAGTYFIETRQGNQVKTIRVIKL
jgi:hypothetical protein